MLSLCGLLLMLSHASLAFAVASLATGSVTPLHTQAGNERLSEAGAYTGKHAVLGVARGPLPAAGDGPELGKGIFLVASRELRDPNFTKTVVLLVAHSDEGAMGVVVNRPTHLALGTVLPDVEGLEGLADMVYIGGPVGLTQVTLLLRAASPPEESTHVFGDIYFSGSLTALTQYLSKQEGAGMSAMHAFAGHAGWGPGQLEGELERGDWHLVEADAETVFNKKPEDIWPALIRATSGVWVMKGNSIQMGSADLSPLLVPPRI